MTDPTPVALLYARQSLSRDQDRGDSVSVADQERMTREHCAREGWVVGGAYRDVDVSGATSAREGLDRLRADMKRLRPAYVVVRDISRLARDVQLFLSLTDEVQAAGAEIVSAIGEPLTDRTLATILSAMSQHDRLMLAGRVAGGVRQHARNGKHHGGVAFGYRRIAGVLAIVESEAWVVREVHRRYAEGAGIARIREWLIADPDVPPSVSGGGWTWDAVRAMLTRTAYAGDVAVRAKRDVGGRLWPAVATRDAHPAIVDRETFDAVQRRIASIPSHVRREVETPLAGIMRCAACGGRLYPIRVTAHGRQRLYARCASGNRITAAGTSPPCPGRVRSVQLAKVEAKVREALAAFVASALDPQSVAAADARHAPKERAARDRQTARLAEIVTRRARLLEAYESGALPLETWADRDGILAREAAAAAAELAATPEPPDPAAVRRIRADVAGMDLDPAALDGAGLRAVLTRLGAELWVDLDARTVRLTVDEPFASAFPVYARSG